MKTTNTKRTQRRTVMVVIGTRPEAIKLAPLVLTLKKDERFRVTVCNTAQHRHMVDEVLDLFGVHRDFDLDVMKADQTIIHVQNTIMERFTAVLERAKPEMVVVQGDTTTAYACALAAFYRKIKVTHVEAGLRTFDKRNPFPEEANRRMISVLADLHCAPTVGSRENLRAEGIPAKDICTVGNTVIDALQWMRREMSEKARRAAEIRFHAAGKRVVLVTAHRRENWGAPLAELCKGIAALAKTHDDVVFVWPLHPHPQVRSVVNPLLQGIVNVVLCEPLRYDECVFLLDRAHTVVTDSGGVQEEAAAIGKPICVFRKTTERPEVIACGAGELLPCTAKGVISRVGRLLDDALWHKKRCKATKAFGDGRASQKIADRMFRCLGEVA